ncbi:MAG: stage IV sporulation protein A [Oscillospiraceae bacterium]|nr:stage IV sporulation protein A [Oscillospiraceae bacterium]
MVDTAIYRDMAERTGGDVYIGVVGPVRTGKSTFIKRFMETMVLPKLDDMYVRERARDELPQSGSGRTIMTAEPKFVPETAAELSLDGGARCAVRLVDSVGYMVEGAAGNLEDGAERMVMTPWYDEEIPMSRAAEEGTRRVIADHSTVGILITTDGSVCGISREDYEAPEAKAAEELSRIGKPFIILLNTEDPKSEAALALAAELSERYERRCIPVNCLQLDENGMTEVLKELLYEFPVNRFEVYLPAWMDALDAGSEVRRELFSAIAEAAEGTERMGDAAAMAESLAEHELVSSASVHTLSLGDGGASLSIALPQQLYYRTISEESGFDIRNDRDLMLLLRSVSSLKEEYERVHDALEDVRTKGYGIVMPTIDEMTLEEPQIVRQGGRYGVKLKASAPSIHMILANIETEVSPAIGGERASEEVINFLLQGYDGDINRIWESNIFGKALNDIAGEGLTNKIKAMPDDAQSKLRTTIQRIINEGGGGLICIIL